MYSIQIKNKAITLRKQGKSIYEISRILNFKPTSVSYWCKDIKLSDILIKKISDNGKKKARKAMLIFTEKQRMERLDRQAAERQTGKTLLG